MALAVFTSAAARAATPLHITSAELLNLPAHGYSAPPYQAQDVAEVLQQGKWEKVALPHALVRPLLPPGASDVDTAAHSVNGAEGPPTTVSWYRMRVAAGAENGVPDALYIPRWKTDGQLAVYGDNHLLYASHASVYWNGWNIPLWIPLKATAGAAVPHTILLRIERPRDSSGGISSLWVGESADLIWRYRLRYLLQIQLPYTSSAAFLAVGLFSFFVWCKFRSESSYLLLFYIAVASFLRTLHYHVGEGRLPLSDEWFSWLTVNSIYWLVLATHYFLNYLHRRPSRWINRMVLTVTLAMSVLTMPLVSGSLIDLYGLAPLVYVMLILVGSSVSVFGARQSWRARSGDGLLLSGWGLLGMLMGVHDWLLQNNYVSVESLYLGPYSNGGAFAIFMYIIFRRYIHANESVRLANATLKSRLQQREDELQESYQRLREIEHRQMLSNERQRIMQDMHDGMGSSLLTALLAAERGNLDKSMLADVLRNCIDDLKLTIDSMEPVQTDLLLLLATLRFRLTPRLESAGIRLRWDIDNVPALDWLDPRNALHILRILQEAFANIIKHAQATEIRVATVVRPDHVLVIVTDNGSGFQRAHESVRKGKGLNNQMRRAASIGAAVHWDSDDTGTRMTLQLPIHFPARH
ncbi:sensor histidine kinase [Herbaspirillum lusitanum]|uniref:histidine kinase n=1 Tax=Herbaspirillum lusitanum TaxID=213312 RepID=A0ABW9A5V0_9BURK